MSVDLAPIFKRYSNGLALELVAYYPDYRGWYESSEIETQDWMIAHVGRDWHCLDVGAHIGYYSMLLSTLAPEGAILAVEACGPTCGMFWRNVERNRALGLSLGNIGLANVAAGALRDRELETLWLTGQGPEEGKTVAEFDFWRIDDLTAGWARLDLIKSDVDGWDYDVLCGARKTLREKRPVVIAEINHALAWRGFNVAQVDELLVSLGYRHRPLDAQCPGNWLMWPEEGPDYGI